MLFNLHIRSSKSTFLLKYYQIFKTVILKNKINTIFNSDCLITNYFFLNIFNPSYSIEITINKVH